MAKAIGDFYGSQLAEVVLPILLFWGLFGIVVLIFSAGASPRLSMAARAGVGVMYLSIAGSMVFEEYLPAWPRLTPGARWTMGIGLGIILAGSAVVLAGGVLLSRRLLDRMGRAIAKSPRPEQSPRLLGRFALMAGGFALIFFGASLYHENRFPLAWFWGWFGL